MNKSYDKTREHIKKKRHRFADRGLSCQSSGFSSSYVQVWELDSKESRVLKNWCFQTVVLEKTLESPSESKEIKPVSLKGNQPWLMLKKKLHYFGHLKWRADSLEKTPMLGKTGWRRRKGQQRMRWLDCIIHSMDRNSGISGRYWRTGQLGMLYSWGHKESDTSKGLSNN